MNIEAASTQQSCYARWSIYTVSMSCTGVLFPFMHTERGLMSPPSDLKPENILLDYTGHIALCDFGLCKLNMSETEKTNSEFQILLQPSLRCQY